MGLYLEGKEIIIREAEVEDASFVLSLRLDDDLNKHLGKTEDDIEKQKQYLLANKQKSDDLYFIIENKKSELFGTARIYNLTDEKFTYGSWIMRKDAPYSFGIETYFLISDCAYYVLKCQRAEFDVIKENEAVVKFHQRMGSNIVGEDNEHFFFKQTLAEYEKIRKKYKRYVVPDPSVFVKQSR